MKRFLGIICLLYAFLFGYVVLFDKLKLFLAPQLQIYVKLSIIPLLLIGIVLLLNNKIKYKFKISDLVLLLPLVLFIFTSDGRLTASFASNRTTNFTNENKTQYVETDYSIDNKDDTKEKKYDFSNPYFEIIDKNYNELANYITMSPKAVKFLGKTIKVKGFAFKKAEFLSDEYFAIGKYVISCCAADATFAGFIVKYDTNKIIEDNWYEIEGVLELGKDIDGYDIIYIKVINIKDIASKDEEQYIYPCYYYDDGTCSEATKYDLEY